MRVIVTGGRHWVPVGHNGLWELLRRLEPTVIVQGGCPTGADFWARQYAREHKLYLATFRADWARHGKAAGPLRNAAMVAAGADVVVACPGGNGTADCVKKAAAAGIKVLRAGD